MRKMGLEVMLQRDQLSGLTSLYLELCEHCLYGKKNFTSFIRTGHEKKSSPLELVHFDVSSPEEVTSLDGANYFVTFLDDCTQKFCVYMLNKNI